MNTLSVFIAPFAGMMFYYLFVWRDTGLQVFCLWLVYLFIGNVYVYGCTCVSFVFMGVCSWMRNLCVSVCLSWQFSNPFLFFSVSGKDFCSLRRATWSKYLRVVSMRSDTPYLELGKVKGKGVVRING